MNISGNQQYSKTTVGLRQAQSILDQQFKLLFIYPMLCDKSLTKYQNLIRDFITVSMGKELFISNSLNMVSMASSITPLIDEHGNIIKLKNEYKGVESNTSNNQNLFFSLMPSDIKDTQQQVKFDVEQQVKNKTARIKQLIKIDPMYAQFRPYLEMITLNNFIDVPIIIGTKLLSINSLVLLLVLTVSVASKGKYKLNNPDNISKIFKIINSVGTDDFHTLLNRLTLIPPDPWWKRMKNVFFNMIRLPVITDKRVFGIESKKMQYEKLPIRNTTEILKTIQTELHTSELFFKLMTDPKMLESQTGLKLSTGQLSKTFMKIDSEINNVFNNAITQFLNLWALYGVPIFKTFVLLLMPISIPISVSKLMLTIEQGDSSGLSIGLNTGVLSGLQDIFEIVKTEVNNVIQKDADKSDEILKNMKSFCTKSLDKNTKIIIDLYSGTADNSLISPVFTVDDYISFEKALSKSVHASTSSLQEIIRHLNIILPKETIKIILSKSTDLFQNVVNQVAIYLSGNNHQYTDSKLHQLLNNKANLDKFVDSNINDIINYMNFLLFYTIQIALCNYVEEVKVTVKTTKHDVLDSNNYTLIIPLETIVGLANAYAAKSFKSLTVYNANKNKYDVSDKIDATELIQHINSNYIQGIIKYMQKMLDIPNLIIIDESKQEVYYQLMYQSKLMKMKLNSLSTFIDEIKNKIIN